MAAPIDDGLDAANDQPAKKLTNTAPDFIANHVTIGGFPTRHNTVTAEILARLIGGENLTGMNAVFSPSTTRLAAVVDYLVASYG